ncbi:bifunctional diguanylate cyclase/phosphohydrolase [Catellatospora tritici]|uniref:bifunctional diguanylate cyclase/phosphohydrolase n=1 Tax=Catellatospora tritici TaxID=2851566 RepID=UPI001C2DE5A0|nr:diguanylate cyclase [Catellatospora tritici]MBV1856715.1 diguanylate cyclase [Catellatospora tritici]
MRRRWISLAGGDRVIIGFAFASLGWLVMYAALTYAGRHSPALARFVGEILYLIPVAVLAALSFNAVRHTTGRIRTAWWLLLGSNLLWLAGDMTWAFYVYTEPNGPPVPSVADVGYLTRYLLAMPAIMIGLGLKLRGLLDALLVAAAGAAIGWQVILSPLAPGSWNPADFVTFLYPVFSVVIVSVLAGLLMTGSHQVPASMVMVGVAFGMAALLDAAFAYSTVLGPYSSSSWLNLGWQAEALLLGLAALVAARRPSADDRWQLRASEVSFLPALVAVLIVGGLAVADMILVGQIGRVTLSVAMLLIMGLLIRQIFAARDRARLNEQLRASAVTDSLTGLHNRRFFQEAIAVETDEAHWRAPLSLILMDLDHFKDVNDNHGHLAGDAVLAEVATRLRRCLRASDLICRYGGEEFVCLLPRTGVAAAMELAEQIRADLRSTPVTVPGVAEPLALTASFGVACADPAEDVGNIDHGDLVNAADQALYRAKALGRDRVIARGLIGQVEADPACDLPPGLVWLADQVDRLRGDGARGAAMSRWAWKTATRLGLDEVTQLSTVAAARVHGIDCISLRCDPPPPCGSDPTGPGHARDRPQGSVRLLTALAQRPDLAPLIAAHHEHYDGTGHPNGLAGHDIPIGARIIAICDAWATVRPAALRPSPSSLAEARRALIAGRGTRLDPAILDIFLALLDEGAIEDSGPMRQAPVAIRSSTAAAD